MKENKHKKESVFKPNSGMPPLGQALPLAFQHVVAMIAECVTLTIIIAGVAGLSGEDKVIIVQTALVVPALAALLQVFPVGFRKGNLQFEAGLPLIVGVRFAYVTSISTIVEGYGIATIFEAGIVGGIVTVLVGLSYNKIKSLFPPLIVGIVILCIDLSLYPIAIHYIAGGRGSESYGSWQNWLVATLTLTVVIIYSSYGKGITKLASVLIGIIVGYGVTLGFGTVDFNAVGRTGILTLPKIIHFGIEFKVSSCVIIGLLFAINSLQTVGDVTAITMGGMDREATDKELRGGILGFGLGNVVGAFFGGLPNVTLSQNVGIVTTIKVVNHRIAALTAIILGITGILPKFSAFLANVPQCVLDGATLTVFAAITVTGIHMMFNTGLSVRSGLIVGIAVTLGAGVAQASDVLCDFPSWMTVVFAKTSVVVAAAISILLNLLLPKDKEERQGRYVAEVQE